MVEEIKIWKDSVNASGNDWGYSGTITVDLTEMTDKVRQSSANDVKFLTRGTRKEDRKPEKRAFNYKMITDKFTITGYLKGPDAVEMKNRIIAMQQAGGLANFKYRDEIFNGTANPKYVTIMIADFDDDFSKSIAISGTHTGGMASSNLIDSTKNFLTSPQTFRVPTTVKNITGSTSGTANSITDATTVACSTVTFNTGDSYQILTAKDNEIVYKFTIQLIKSVPRS